MSTNLLLNKAKYKKSSQFDEVPTYTLKEVRKCVDKAEEDIRSRERFTKYLTVFLVSAIILYAQLQKAQLGIPITYWSVFYVSALASLATGAADYTGEAIVPFLSKQIEKFLKRYKGKKKNADNSNDSRDGDE